MYMYKYMYLVYMCMHVHVGRSMPSYSVSPPGTPNNSFDTTANSTKAQQTRYSRQSSLVLINKINLESLYYDPSSVQ